MGKSKNIQFSFGSKFHLWLQYLKQHKGRLSNSEPAIKMGGTINIKDIYQIRNTVGTRNFNALTTFHSYSKWCNLSTNDTIKHHVDTDTNNWKKIVLGKLIRSRNRLKADWEWGQLDTLHKEITRHVKIPWDKQILTLDDHATYFGTYTYLITLTDVGAL